MRVAHVLLVLALSAPATFAQRAAGEARAWEHESSDLAVDPRIHFGALDNGLRFAWARNSEPHERCYVRLHVDAGSLAETDSQNGMAHFLEHMVFNGSENFAPGMLIEWFQEQGMSFGADTNAHTNFSETVYKLDLPRSDGETLRSGLRVLRDFADGALLEEAEVQAEKGVIDGEEREYDSADYRVMLRALGQLYDGTRIPERMIIGTPAVRKAFTAESVGAFYRAWYRPENMTVVIVGDLGELDPQALIEESFGDMAVPEEPVALEPALGEPTMDGLFFHVHEPEIARVSISLERLRPWEDKRADTATLRGELPLTMARAMLNLRLRELAKKEGTPFLAARTTPAGGLHVFDGESLAISAEPPAWAEALAAADYELRRAIQFGFQPAELDEVRSDFLRALDEAVERAKTADSRSILREILAACERRAVPTDAQTEYELYAPALAKLTVEQCHDAFVEAWSRGEWALHTSGALDLGDEAEATLRAALELARQREVEKGEAIDVGAFAYASDPDGRGEIAVREEVEDLDFTRVEFANGVRMNVKRTDFKDRQILVSAQIGEGGLTLAPEDYPVQWVADAVFNGGGLGAHSEDELRRLTAGRRVGVGFDVGQDAFTLSGPQSGTTADDLLLQFELMCAYLTDPGWRDEGLRQLRERLPSVFEDLRHRPQGPLYLAFFPELFSGDMRLIGLPPRAAIEAVDVGQVRDWLTPILSDAPVELTVVGDLDPDEAIDLAARTFGRLPRRRALDPHDERRRVKALRAGLEVHATVETKVAKASIFLVIPTSDGLETTRRRSLVFLGNEVLQDRLRVEIREKLGASYAPASRAQVSAVFPGLGMIVVTVVCDVDAVDSTLAACRKVVADLAQNGVEHEQVERLLEPIQAQLRDGLRTNGYWQAGLAEVGRRAGALDDLRSVEAFYEELPAKELSELAARDLRVDQASVLVVTPGPGAEPAQAEEAAAETPPADDR